MKFSTAIICLLGATPYVAQALAFPNANADVTVSENNPAARVLLHESSLMSKREDDDEWLMVIYNNGEEGDQCGGTPNEFHAKGSLCQGVTGAIGKVCADVKVNANFGFAKCDFTFKKDGTSCGGDEIKKVTVEKGKDNNGVSLTDEVRFVQITCSD